MTYQLLKSLYYSDRAAYEEVYQHRFHDDRTVHIGVMIHGNPAFYLPTPEIYEKTISIQRNVQRIIRMKEQLPPIAIYQFIMRCLIDEIVITNDIEGVSSTRREISKVLDDLGTKDHKDRFWGLVHAYSELTQTPHIHIENSQDIRNIYDKIVLDEVVKTDPENRPDGKIFRAGPVHVHSSRMESIHTGVYPEESIIATMDAALSYLNNGTDDPLFRTAIFHYLTGYIHPFYDGNGRLNRFISSSLIADELDPLMAYRLSFTVKENISKYNRAFRTCNEELNRGDLTPFLDMFLSVIMQATTALLEALNKRLYRLHQYTGLIPTLPHSNDKRVTGLYDALIQFELFSESGADIKTLTRTIGASSVTIKKYLDLIRKEGLLKETKISRKKYYGIKLENL